MRMGYENRGYEHNNKLVCSNCIDGKELKQFVIEDGSEDECDFCGDEGVCVTIETLCGEIMANYIRPSYTSAANEMNYDSKEEGYHGATTWDTPDLLSELNDIMQLESEVLEEVCKTMNMDEWCKVDPYGEYGSEE